MRKAKAKKRPSSQSLPLPAAKMPVYPPLTGEQTPSVEQRFVAVSPHLPPYALLALLDEENERERIAREEEQLLLQRMAAVQFSSPEGSSSSPSPALSRLLPKIFGAERREALTAVERAWYDEYAAVK